MAEENKFNIVVSLVVIVAVMGILLTVFALVQKNNESSQLSSLARMTSPDNNTDGKTYNVSDSLTYVADQYGTLNQIINGTRTLIKFSPPGTFSCTNVYVNGDDNQTASSRPISLTVANGGNSSFVVGETEAFCSGDGYLTIYLAGNTTNGSTLDPAGINFNLTYSAARWGGAWNTSKAISESLHDGARLSSTYYVLIVLIVVLSVVAGFGVVVFASSSGGGGGFNFRNPLDFFER